MKYWWIAHKSYSTMFLTLICMNKSTVIAHFPYYNAKILFFNERISHSYITKARYYVKKLLESVTNLIYRIQISRLVVPKKIFAPKCLEWVKNLSKTDIILEQPEKAHVSCEISRDSARFRETLRDFMWFREIFRDFARIYEISRDFTRWCKISRV